MGRREEEEEGGLEVVGGWTVEDGIELSEGCGVCACVCVCVCVRVVCACVCVCGEKHVYSCKYYTDNVHVQSTMESHLYNVEDLHLDLDKGAP